MPVTAPGPQRHAGRRSTSARLALAVVTALAGLAAAAPAGAAADRALLELRGRLPAKPAELDVQTADLERGETLIDVLVEAGAAYGEAFQAAKRFGEVYDPRQLRPRDDLRVLFDRDGAFLGFVATPENAKILAALRQGPEQPFRARAQERELERRLAVAEGKISASFYAATRRADLPVRMRQKLISILSWSVDFKRDLRQGDRFAVLYERYHTPNGRFIRTGNIVYAHLQVNGEPRRLVRYTDRRGRPDFYNLQGESARRALTRFPTDVERISDDYGMRRHPITGERAMHAGTDFPTPPGTPIEATGEGVVTMARWWGSYGRIVRIRHNDTYKTAYSHMSRFAEGIEVGERVEQGEVIGYAGSTGRVTGPHLHYEVLKNGERVDPMSAELPAGRNLDGAALARFRKHRDKVLKAFAKRSEDIAVQVAQSSPGS